MAGQGGNRVWQSNAWGPNAGGISPVRAATEQRTAQVLAGAYPYGPGPGESTPNKGGKGGKGKNGGPGKGNDAEPADMKNFLQPPPITIGTLQAGEVVDVFHRYCQDPNGYFMVNHHSSGILHPSIGRTDGWTTATVTENWNMADFRRGEYKTWVEIQWSHPIWYNRRGHKLDVNTPSMTTQRVLPEQIRQRTAPSEAQEQPVLTLFHVRWGGEQPVNPVTEGAGGWGAIGSTPSDNYINGWEDVVFNTLGPNYEIISAFIQGSDELKKMCPPLLRHLFTGKKFGALYFLWPITFQDGHNFPAYVDRQLLFSLMVEMESTGIPTRFPHASHLYKIFASKEWTAQMCLHPLLKVPLTTMVSRQAIVMDACAAANNAVKALEHLAVTRATWAGDTAQGAIQRQTPINHQRGRGISKLGWSWEAMDVSAWTTAKELQSGLERHAEQPGSNVDLVFVQEWVDFDVEMRHFIIEPDLSNPASLKPKKIIYTVFKSKEDGCFRNFDRYDRQGCLNTCFWNDSAALAECEKQAEELIVRWLEWLQAQCSELPVVCRFDIMAKRLGPGEGAVTTGELTELGGCFLGWPQGPKTVMAAMLRSCIR